MHLHSPSPRSESLLRKLWLWPTNWVGFSVARLVRAEGPFRVGSDRAPAHLYLLPDDFRWWFGAVALGHVILAQPGFLRGSTGRWTLAHELSHTRQHDVLGPVYLPLHGLSQLLSAALSVVRPVEGFSVVHAYNLLERAFLCVPYDYLVDLRKRRESDDSHASEVLAAFGVQHFNCSALQGSASTNAGTATNRSSTRP